MAQHALRRTSPKGQSFVGVCTKCGRENLTLADMENECANVRNVTDEQALSEALQPERMH